MSTPNDGGPAFPTQNGCRNDPGMSLRDHFAGQALQGWLASFDSSSIHPVANETQAAVALEAYAMADAMLAARETGKESA